MSRLRVVEFVRGGDGVWSLPGPIVAATAARFPEVEFRSPADRDAVERELPGADVVIGWPVRSENFAACERLRWVHLTAAGVGSMLFPELVASDVILTNSRGLHATSISEHVLGVMLALVRKLHDSRDAQRDARWTQDQQWLGPPSFGQLEGATLGLVGLGAIGSAIAVRARAFGMRVIAVRRRPSRSDGIVAESWGPERLGDLCAQSDFVVFCTPLTGETKGMLGAAEIARMRPTTFVVNIGRGPVIDEPALITALQEHRIAGAALDVFAEEPLPATSPLWSMPQVIVTPHVSGFGPRLWERAMEIFARNLRAFLDGKPMENVVDKVAGY
jgi:phosphoglycerate dehydrogenase-like enzyme